MTHVKMTEGAQAAPPILSVSGLGKSFGAVHALSEVSFDLRAGEAVGIVGPNGAGKSTFLAALTGAFAPSTGTILLDGADVTGTPAEIMCRLGVVRTHQIPRPFGGLTVFENARLAASFGGPEHDTKQGDADALAYGALKLCRMMPLVNTQADRLGLLDRKRLEMARALATSPRVILLDEVGGGLTDAEAEVLVEIIREIRASGCAIVWIEHIVHVLLQVSERLICMDMGRIIADGEPQAVMRDPLVMEAYLGQGVT